MAVPFVNDTVGDLLNNYVKFITKQMQTVADALWGADNDNSNQPITFPNSLQARGLIEFEALALGIDLQPLVDAGYYGWDYNYGRFDELYSININYINGNLTISGLTPLGKFDSSRWSNVVAGAQELAESLLTNYVNQHAGDYVFTKTTFPDLPVLHKDGVDYGGNVINFYQDDEGTEVYSGFTTSFPKANGTLITANTVALRFYDVLTVTDGIYNAQDFNIAQNIAGQYLVQQDDALFVTNTNDQTFIDNYITNNNAEHNYVYNYTTQGGDTITTYYGDNYVITKTAPDQQITYNEYYTILKKVTDDINDDDDYDIEVPTYIDNKFPPEPPMPPLESDDQTDGGDYGSAEFVRMYACTSSELNTLMLWMSGGGAGTSGTNPVTVPDNFNPMDQIIGLIGYPMEIETGVGDDTTFTFRNAANQTINTGWATKTTMANDRLINFGTVDIPFWESHENGVPFLDYSATVECYVPFCGIMALDPQSVMGCTLTCKMWVDYATGDCSCIIYSNYGGGQHPVAYSSGNCGASQPMSAAAFGQLQGARATASHKMSQAVLGGVKNLVTSTIGGARSGYIQGGAASTVTVPAGQSPALANAIQGAGASLGFKAGATGSAIGSAIDLGVTLTQTNLDNKFATEMTKNSLGTSVSGNFGQQTAWHYFNRPYIKVTWPTPISKRVTKYGHTYGVPVYKDATVSEYTGYTIFNNVDVDGITGATPNELSAIKGYLETGVYINGGGE